MSEIMRDPMWQFIIGVLIAIAAIVVTIIVYLKQRTRKSLSYEILSLNPLLSVKEEIKEKVQILYEGKPVEKVHLILARIINSGNVPIESNQYERHVSLSFGKEAQILTAEVNKTNPESLQASIKVEGNKVVLTPVLLNDGDSITLKMLVSQFDEISVDGRIVGVKRIEKYTETSFRIFFLTLSGLVLYTVGFFSLLVFPNIMLFYILTLSGGALLLASTLLEPRFRRLFRRISAEIETEK